MILVDLLINLTGAVIGAGIASSAALWIAYRQRRDAAKENLRALLMAQLDMTFAEVDVGKITNPALIAQHNFRVSYPNILAAYINYRSKSKTKISKIQESINCFTSNLCQK